MRNAKVLSDTSRTPKIERGFTNRLQLWWKEEKLKENIEEIRKWRECIEKLAEKSDRRTANLATATATKSGQRPSCLLWRISKGIYEALSERWKCSAACPCSHQVQICLHTTDDLHRNGDPESLQYKILLSGPHENVKKPSIWRESLIQVKSYPRRNSVTFHPKQSLEVVSNMCSIIQAHTRAERPRASIRDQKKLTISAEYIEEDASTSLYRARPYLKSKLGFEPSINNASLADVITSQSNLLDLRQRRELALVLVHGLLTLGNPWLAEKWTKADIYLFWSPGNQLVVSEPFILSDMRQPHQISQASSLDAPHPIPSVLSLGIVLLEIETGKSIESMRTESDYLDPDAQLIDEYTDQTAALRAAKALSTSTPDYQEAVLACLCESTWADFDDLSQEDARKKLYELVVDRIEGELESLS